MVEHVNITPTDCHPPKPHASTHTSTDPIPLAVVGTNGLLKSLDDNAAHFMNGKGVWATPPGSGGSSTWEGLTDTVAAIAANELVIGNGAGDELGFINPNTLDVDKVDGCDAGVATTDIFKIPALSGHGNECVKVNAGGTALVLGACGTGGTSDHALLTHLDYASAGHTGFSPDTHTHVLANITDITSTADELNFVDGVTSAIQDQFAGKLSNPAGGGLDMGTNLITNVTTITATSHKSGDSYLIDEKLYLGSSIGTIESDDELEFKPSNVHSATIAKTVFGGLKVDKLSELTLDAGITLSHTVDMSSKKITSLAPGAASTDAATVGQVVLIPTSSSRGDILIRNVAGWTRLAAGASGHFLKTQGASFDPVWAAAGGGADYTIDGGNATSIYTGTATIDCGGAA